MDRHHVQDLRKLQGDIAQKDARGQIRLFLDFLPPGDPQLGCDVPDPYYGDMSDYELSLDLIERGTPGLIEALKRDFL